MKLKGFAWIQIFIIAIIFFVIGSMIILYKPEQIMQRPENQPESDWQWLNNQKKLYEINPGEIGSILEEVWQRFPEKEERLKALAILRLGTSYQFGCLGEESGRDKDPIFRLDVTDCTAFVLTNAALLHSENLEEARGMMKFLNYQPDEDITFENRLHFTTYRNLASPYFRDITEEVAGKNRIIAKEIILNKIKEDNRRLIDIDWQKKITLKYIPNEYITKELFQILPKSIGIAFVRKGDAEIGLDVAHEGFLFDNQLFLHASLMEKKVVAINLWDYYFAEDDHTPKFDGLIFFEIK